MVLIILPALNKAQELTTLATFTGAGSPAEIVNATTLNGSIDNSSAQSLFKFYTTPNAGDENYPENTSDVARSNWSVLAKANTAGVFVKPTAKTSTWASGDNNDIRTGEHEMVFKLAEAIFGSSEAGDLLSNPASIMSSFNNSIGDCVSAVNVDNSSSATKQLINGLLYSSPERFALKYKAVVSDALFGASIFKGLTAIGTEGAISTVDVEMSGASVVTKITVTSHTSGSFVESEKVSITDGYGGSDVKIVLKLTNTHASVLNSGTGEMVTPDIDSALATMGTYTSVTAVGETSTATATVTVLCNTATSVSKLFVTTVATGVFQKGEKVTFTNGGGSGKNVTIEEINSVQTAILNGTLDNVAGTEAPLEPADKLRVIFTVNSHVNQTNASGAPVSVAYKANFDFISS